MIMLQLPPCNFKVLKKSFVNVSSLELDRLLALYNQGQYLQAY